MSVTAIYTNNGMLRQICESVKISTRKCINQFKNWLELFSYSQSSVWALRTFCDCLFEVHYEMNYFGLDYMKY